MNSREEKGQGDAKFWQRERHMPTYHGTVVNISDLKSKGYGFIKPDDGGSIFFHIKGYHLSFEKQILFHANPSLSN